MIVSERKLLADAAMTAFKLNGQFLGLAEELARPAGLTAAWWQVLGAVVVEPLPVAGIAREMGITRQSVQRVADILVRDGHAEYTDNPAHRRAKLLSPTETGRAAMERVGPQHAKAAHRLAEVLGTRRFERAVAALTELSIALDELASSGPGGRSGT